MWQRERPPQNRTSNDEETGQGLYDERVQTVGVYILNIKRSVHFGQACQPRDSFRRVDG